MRIKVLFIALSAFILSAAVTASAATVTALAGTVKYMKTGATAWQPAVVGIKLANGDRLESEKDSWAILTFDEGHTAKLSAETSLVLALNKKAVSIEMIKGDILSKVKKLSSKASYEVLTPQSVCAVRGTEFSVNVGETTLVKVIEGSVSAKELITGTEIIIPAGKYSIVIKNQAPTEPDDIANLVTAAAPAEEGTVEEEEEDSSEETASEDEQESEETVSEEPSEETEEGEEKTAEPEPDQKEEKSMQETKNALRQEMRGAVIDIKVQTDSARDTMETVKETDTSIGRTMKDVHGNLVRVEQYVLRPTASTIQFLNVTKRSEGYKYSGKFGVTATPGVSRLDSFEVKTVFNKALPATLSEFPKYFKDMDDAGTMDDFHPVTTELKLTNQSDSIIMTSRWDPALDAYGEEKGMTEPVIKFQTKDNGTWNLVTDSKDDFVSSDARYILLDSREGDGSIAVNAEDSLQGWAISPGILLYSDANGDGIWNVSETTTKWVRTGVEGWVINSEGKPFSEAVLADSSNPFDLLKNIALEASMVVRHGTSITDGSYVLSRELINDTDNGGTTNENKDVTIQNAALVGFNLASDLFSKNIDLVVTPDFILPTIQDVISDPDALKALTDDSKDASSTDNNNQ